MRPKPTTETQEHIAIARYLAVALAGHAVAWHTRNEDGSAWGRIQAVRMGILGGNVDWFILDGGRLLGFEIKPRGWKARHAKSGKYTPHELRQIETHKRLRMAGAVVEIIETLDELRERLVHHCVPLREVGFRAAVERGLALAAADPDTDFIGGL